MCAFVFAPAGVVCGFIARRQISQTGESGDGLALAAIIVSIAQIVLFLIVMIFLLVGLLAFGSAVSHLPDHFPTPDSSFFPSPLPTS